MRFIIVLLIALSLSFCTKKNNDNHCWECEVTWQDGTKTTEYPCNELDPYKIKFQDRNGTPPAGTMCKPRN